MAEFKEISEKAKKEAELLLNESAPIRRTMVSFVDMCCSIIKPKSGSDVLLPYAGDAQIANLLPKCSCDCYEPNPKVWEYGQKCCKAESTEIKIKTGTAIDDAEKKQYDYVFTFPFGRLQDKKSVADYLYNIASQCLKDRGVMCCLLPAGFCYSRDWCRLRNIVKEEQYNVVSIILPWGLCQPISGISLCAFILFKDNGGGVTLVDAQDESFIEKKDDMRILKTQTIVDSLNRKEKKYVWSGSVGELVNDANLSPEYYLFMQYEPTVKAGEKIFRLGDFVEVIPNTFYSPDKTISMLGFGNLPANYLNCSIFYKDLPRVRETPNDDKRQVSTECLFAGYYNGVFRVGRGRNFSISTVVKLEYGIIPFKLKPDSGVIEDFLLRSIVSVNVAEQARILKGRIPEDLFLQFKIVVPSEKEQERLCKEDGQESLNDADRKLKKAYEKLESDFKEYVDDMHIKKHAIGQTIFDINNWWSVLQRVRVENGGRLNDNTVVGNRTKIKVSEIYEGLHSAIFRLQQQISKMDRGNTLSAEVFSLAEFIENYIINHQSSLFEFEYNAEKHRSDKDVPALENVIDEKTGQYRTKKHMREIKKGEPYLEEYVDFPREALSMVLENIVSNACSHGFTNSFKENKIRIDFEWVGGYVVAAVSNNGSPLPDGFLPSEVFTYGETRAKGEHFGLGGYEIKRLMREFGGDAEIESILSGDYTVSYKLTFPPAWGEFDGI